MNQDEQLLNELKQVVLDNLANEQFGVDCLSKSIGLSRSHLHRRLKKLKGLSISQFIRQIRLIQALKLLREDELTTAEIAYRVGFNSPSYFHKCFHNYYGYPPSEAKRLLIDRNNEFLKASEWHAASTKPINLNNRVYKITTITLILLLISTWTFYNFITRESSPALEKSIAILPLKNLSENIQNQHLADGIMEDILNRLSQIKKLKVKSRISSEQYRNPHKSLPEIAKELNVAYVLEGSIISTQDKVRVYVQLIEAQNDYHFWSKEYNVELTDIFELTSNVSQQIAEALEVALYTNEVENNHSYSQ